MQWPLHMIQPFVFWGHNRRPEGFSLRSVTNQDFNNYSPKGSWLSSKPRVHQNIFIKEKQWFQCPAQRAHLTKAPLFTTVFSLERHTFDFSFFSITINQPTGLFHKLSPCFFTVIGSNFSNIASTQVQFFLLFQRLIFISTFCCNGNTNLWNLSWFSICWSLLRKGWYTHGAHAGFPDSLVTAFGYKYI